MTDEQKWLHALMWTALWGQPAMNEEHWEMWDRAYGDEWIPRITGMADHLLEVAMLRAIVITGCLP